ncbi:MAG: preprotein translocase subunit YajC [Spirochaetales bacterium]|nr:preprotein translocase subunit YajC [Spirochaetales bacterium]
MSFIPFLQAAEGAAPSASAPGSMLVSFFPVILIIVVFYFLMIRPQSKKQKETERMLNALKKGDKVITIGGIHGVVSSVKENTVIVKVDDDCKIEFNRTAISTVELSDEEKAKLAQAQAAKKSKGFFKSKKSEEKIESEKTSDKE